MIKENFLKNKLANNEEVLGTWLTVPSSVVADIIASSGLDFIVIDAEHSPISYETAQLIMMACESRAVSPVMGIGGIDESQILKALDIGAHCIHVPNIRNVDEVREIITYAKYPPLGNKGFSPFTRNFDYTAENSSKLEISNLNTLIVIHIEEFNMAQKLENILKEQIDIVFIGLFDISKSIGVPGQINHKKVRDMFRITVEEVKKYGKIPGTIVTSPEMLREVRDMGVRYITYLADCEIIKKEYKEIKIIFDNLRKLN